MEVEGFPVAAAAEIARCALEEDRAFEDTTTLALAEPGRESEAAFVAREAGVAAGMPILAEVFGQLDPATRVDVLVADGAAFEAGDCLARAHGPVAALLSGERVALNLVQRLCGVATASRRYVDSVAGTGVLVLDTRKTTPGLRALEKYAVRCGGGTNHRPDLAAMAMIKDNHRELATARGMTLREAVAAIRELSPGVEVEVEVDTLDQLDQALAAGPEWILLDNMGLDDMREAVARTAGRAKLEASGGITLERMRDVASAGVDAISVGALTHSARALDISMELTLSG